MMKNVRNKKLVSVHLGEVVQNLDLLDTVRIDPNHDENEVVHLVVAFGLCVLVNEVTKNDRISRPKIFLEFLHMRSATQKSTKQSRNENEKVTRI